MRLVILKKRYTSKFNYLAKRCALSSMLVFATLAVLVVPLTSKAKELQVENRNEIDEITDENFEDDYLKVSNDVDL